MSIQAVGWVLDHSQSRGHARLVLISLANHYNAGTGRCDPGQRLLAHEAGISTGSVPTAIRTLVALGEIRVKDPGTSHRAASYELIFAQPGVSVEPIEVRSAGERSDESTLRVRSVSGKVRSVQDRAEPRTIEPTPLASASRPRERDLLFEAVCHATGIDWTQLGPRARGPVNAAVKDLRSVGADPGAVSVRAAALARRYPQAPLTPASLAKHWASLAPAGSNGNGNGHKPMTDEEARASFARAEAEYDAAIAAGREPG